MQLLCIQQVFAVSTLKLRPQLRVRTRLFGDTAVPSRSPILDRQAENVIIFNGKLTRTSVRKTFCSLHQVPPFWPIQGAIYFHRVCLRYRPNLPLALDNVTFETHPHEKIGIVGRTGSGKSSLFLALFRMVEVESGNILIDGINLCHLGLQELRHVMFPTMSSLVARARHK